MTRVNHVAVVLRVAVALDEAASDIIDLPRDMCRTSVPLTKRVSCCLPPALGRGR